MYTSRGTSHLFNWTSHFYYESRPEQVTSENRFYGPCVRCTLCILYASEIKQGGQRQPCASMPMYTQTVICTDVNVRAMYVII